MTSSSSTSAFTAVDLSALAAPGVVETLDFETIFAANVALAKTVMPTLSVAESDPITKILQVFSYAEITLRQRINDAAKAVMLAYATGTDLDHLAALFGATRLMLDAGDADKGIDPTYETDTVFRRRITLAPESYSVAGPEGAYIYHALAASPQVLDASAESPEPADIKAMVLAVLAAQNAPAALVAAMTTALDGAVWPGTVNVAILTRSGETASDTLCRCVQEYLSADTRRPLTDYVQVTSAGIINYQIDATIRTFSGPDSAVVMAAAQTSIDTYVADAMRLGRDITLSGVYAALHVAGVQKVVLASPTADIVCGRNQAPVCTAVKLTYSGIGE